MENLERKETNKPVDTGLDQGANGELTERIKKNPTWRDKRRLIPVALGGLLVLAIAVGLMLPKPAKEQEPGETEGAFPTDAVTYTEPEDDELRRIREYCAKLEQDGELGAAVNCLQEYSKHQPGNPAVEELLSYYTRAYEQQVQETVEGYAAAGQYRDAIKYIDGVRETYECERFRNLSVRCRQEFGMYSARVLAAGKYNTFLISESGDVTALGDQTDGELEADNWSGIVGIAAGDRHVVGMRLGGTVVAAGENDYLQCAVSGWRNVIAISAGDVHTVALTEDGQVLATGYGDDGQIDVYRFMPEAGDRQIVAISAGYQHTLALLEDGTVLAVGSNANGECQVSDWRDIVAICSGTNFAAGLCSDGTVKIAGGGSQSWGVSEWTDIVQLAAGDYYLVGLRADGTVVAAGGTDPAFFNAGQMRVESWYDVVAIAAGNDHTMAIRADGTILAAGSNRKGQCG